MRKVPFKDDEIIEFTTLETSCVYLKGKRMQMSYKYIKDCSLSLSSKLTKRGWRRFGNYYSRPSCKNCNECQSLRIDVNAFKLSKSAQRVIKKNKDTKILIRKPSISQEHLSLYEKYHRYMQKSKGWEYYPLNEESYADLYAKGFSSFGYEVLYMRDEKLIGVDLIDFLEDGISSIYFYYDPDYRSYSLGKYSIYKQIEMAKERELEWIYIGYSVDGCPSLSYKNLYKPNQKLKNIPDLDEDALWA